jgi:allantoinase
VACAVLVRDGRITEITAVDAPVDAALERVLAPDEVLLPGLVDTHVHLQDPGNTAWEDVASATRAAAAGGVTTLIDMPVDSVPPTVDAASLAAKRAAAAGRAYVDLGHWGGATGGNPLEELHDAGVFGFKAFLADPGVPGFAPLDAGSLEATLRRTARLGALLLLHAEDPAAALPPAHSPRYRDFLATRPASVESGAVATALAAVRRTGARLHFVHVSAAASLDLIAAAKAEGLPVSAETCPHYLALSAGTIPDGRTEYRVSPPIRGAGDTARLWHGLADGPLDLVVSDHSPCGEAEGRDWDTAPGGIAALQLTLPVVWTQARRRGFGLADVVRWTSTAPADLAGLPGKGRIEPGADGDLCVLAPDERFVVRSTGLLRSRRTPYEGQELDGVVRETWLAGRPVRGDDPPRGRLLRR